MPTIIPPETPALPAAFDILGIAVFALTGALSAAQMRQTFVTMAFFAFMTGVGGGTLRDLLIGAPVFWVRDPFVVPACLTVAVIAWFTPVRWWQGRLLEWADAIGLTVYSGFGTIKAMAWGVPPIPAIVMGVVTGCVGGIMRDLLAGEPSILLRPELYVTAAALASGLFVALRWIGLDMPVAALIAVALGFSLRAVAIWKGLSLPHYDADR
jgi:uncharacterized membrane protein YeiH